MDGLGTGVNPNGQGPQDNCPDPGQSNREAAFWQQKYFELLLHTTQVITALAQPLFAQQAMRQMMMQAAQGQPVPTQGDPQ